MISLMSCNVTRRDFTYLKDFVDLVVISRCLFIRPIRFLLGPLNDPKRPVLSNLTFQVKRSLCPIRGSKSESSLITEIGILFRNVIRCPEVQRPTTRRI